MADDDWGRTVRILTGYEVPDRATLFDELKGSDGKTPLLNVTIENVGLNVSLRDLGQVGAGADGHGFVLPYYTPQGSGLNLHKISIDFLWNPGERPSQGPGNPLDNFIFGSQVMLEALAGPPFSTQKLGFGGLSVPDNGAVVLKTFSDIAAAFDRSAEFFAQHEAVLKQWLDSFGKDDSHWKGNAAGAFHDLLATLHRNYGDYKEQLVPPGFSPKNFALHPVLGKGASGTKQGDTLVGAANDIHQAAWELSQAWHQWAADPDSNAMAIAARLISDVAQWVQDSNLSKTGLHNQPSGGMWSGPSVPPTTVVAMPGFTAGHPTWGDLSSIDAWANLGNHAVWRWNQKVQSLLGDPARTQVSNVNNALIQASEVVGQGFKTLNTTSISTYQGSQSGTGGLDDITKNLNDTLGDFSKNLNEGLGSVSDNLGEGLGSFSDNLNDSLGSMSNNVGTGLGDFANNLNETLGNASENVGTGLGSFSNNLNESLGGVSDSLGTATDNLGTGIGDFSNNLNESLGGVSDSLGSVTDNLGTATDNLGTGIGDFSNNLNESLGGVSDSLGTGLGDFSNNLNDSLGNVSDNLGSVTDNLGQGLGSLTDNLGTGPGSVDGLTANPGDPTGTGLGIGTPLVPNLPNYASGTGLGTGTTTVQNPDGSTTTTYPDGLVTTTAPDGTVSVRTPDGSTIALNPGGTPTQLPDGTTVSLGADGSLVTQNPDGSTVTHRPDGSLITQNADGSVVTTNPDGSQSFASPNGSVTTIGTDGSETVVSPDGTVTYTSPDGVTTITAPDGSVTTFGPDGTATTVHPNGVTTTLGSDGVTTATGPNGETITANPVPVLSQGDIGGSVLDTMNSLGTIGSNPGAGTTQAVQTPAYEEAGYDTSTDFPSYGSDGGLGLDDGYGGSYGAGQSATGAGMPMGLGGLGGLGGMGGVNGALGADRMRDAMGDPGATTTARPTQAATGHSGTGGTPYMPPPSGQGGQNTESKDRERANWMAEEEDVWGTEDTGNPAVIGRQEQVENTQRNQFMSGEQR
ncbi:AAWKG family protein [Streptomyces flaveolus]|uniref:AAWKG family protein n=1 Tax=Streptomyces flaveolus TaxID=67297 RepID=UPI00167045CC|nr:AAWKG family protein [Streptomyces flaveolus]GGQ79318.1 hypothetical protein GCM10010216_46510 [Streptomyces flaveolus]